MPVAPNRPKGPPLNALRAFETAARHQSFVEAAAELGVTPGAVSQHIKGLEGWVGTSLFTRRSNDVQLTEAGRALMPEFVSAFDALGQAVQTLKSLRPAREVHIATLPGLAQLWLPERLAKLRAALPDVQLSVTAMEIPPNLSRELFDVALFVEEPEQGDCVICADPIFPVCAPDLAGRISRPEDLTALPHLVDQSWEDDWQVWADAIGVTLPQTRRVARYSLYSLAVQEAKSGAGVLMAHGCLVSTALAEGTLVAPLAGQIETGKSLVLRQAPGAAQRSEVEEVVRVLMAN
ncbi:MAG: LysR family transcriptional regulator [Paracoccaceae bacterium]